MSRERRRGLSAAGHRVGALPALLVVAIATRNLTVARARTRRTPGRRLSDRG